MRLWATDRACEGSGRAGRCRDCRKRVVWMILDDGKPRPFDLGFTIREIVTHPTTRRRYLVLDRDDRHDCPVRRRRRRFANT